MEEDAARLSGLLRSFGMNVDRLLATYQKEIVDRQYQLSRVSDTATEIYVSVCVLRRMVVVTRDHHLDEAERARLLDSARYYLKMSARRMKRNMKAMWDNDDQATTELANRLLRS